MAGISGQGTTFNLPNFVGELFGITPEDTPLLASIGGLTGGKAAQAKRFEWEFYDLRAPSDRARLEGANAPTAEARVRANAYNVLQIIQEAVEVSYTKLAARQHLDATVVVGGQANPVVNEFDWQLEQALKQIALDVNYAFINGQFAEPTDNTAARKTRGLLQAIATNVLAKQEQALPALAASAAADDQIDFASAHGLSDGDVIKFTALTGGTGLAPATRYFVQIVSTTAVYVSTVRGGTPVDFTADITAGTAVKVPRVASEDILNAMQLAYDNGGLMIGETRVALVGPLQKRRLTQALVTDKSYQETSRNVGGVNLTVIETDFGNLNIMVDRQMPVDTMALVSLEDLAPVMLEIPGKGFLFAEPLAKVGAAERSQIYGEIGLEYGNERKHAKITGLG